jgi:hypothetical protein
VASLFERLDRGRPPPVEDRPKAGANTINSDLAQKLIPAQKLLDWLQRWDKSTVCIKQILIYGPHSLRGRERAIDSAKTLVEYGWLTPVKKHRRDGHKWEIVRKPVVHPTVATQGSNGSDRVEVGKAGITV